MKVWLCYPMPMDSPSILAEFRPYAERFADTLRKFPPGIDTQLAVVCCHSEPSRDIQEIFKGLNPSYWHYEENGCDMGSAQYLAFHVPESFVIAMTSRCYFHRAGWADPMLAARFNYGPGVYGASGASRQNGIEHLCLRCYGLDASVFNEYPIHLNSRALGPAFENQCGLVNWLKGRSMAAMLVYWDGVHTRDTWFEPKNRFRNGDQSNMLVWDRHTDGWANASPEERTELERVTMVGP
jgi:hypothetical protein